MTLCLTDPTPAGPAPASTGGTWCPEHLMLQPEPRSANHGRRWAVQRAALLGASPAALDVIELLTCELVTNAVRYGPDHGTITVTAERHGDVLDVAVSDDGRDVPTLCDPQPGDVGGRGLRLVEALSTQWGVELHHGHGKSVWFHLRLGTEASAC